MRIPCHSSIIVTVFRLGGIEGVRLAGFRLEATEVEREGFVGWKGRMGFAVGREGFVGCKARMGFAQGNTDTGHSCSHQHAT